MHRFSTGAIDAALGAVKKNFMRKGTVEWSMFPVTKRAFLKKMRKVQPFWPRVSHETTIDLSHFALPSGLKEMTFRFIDPVWGWLMAARAQDPLDLHWKPVMQSSQPVYGGGVQYGEAFAQACASCPEGWRVRFADTYLCLFLIRTCFCFTHVLMFISHAYLLLFHTRTYVYFSCVLVFVSHTYLCFFSWVQEGTSWVSHYIGMARAPSGCPLHQSVLGLRTRTGPVQVHNIVWDTCRTHRMKTK